LQKQQNTFGNTVKLFGAGLCAFNFCPLNTWCP
jgi:uncharacterized membrane protein YjjP (DUF1212 family)